MTSKTYNAINFFKPTDNYHQQNNNIIERMVPPLINEYVKSKVLNVFFETCGISAIANALCMAGWREELELKTRSNQIITIETQVLQEMAKIKKEFPNRAAQPYVDILKSLFNIETDIIWSKDAAVKAIMDGGSAMVCLKKPAHWTAVGAWKDLGIAQEYGYWDSWIGNPYPKRYRNKPPTNRWLNNVEWKTNVQPFAIPIPPFK